MPGLLDATGVGPVSAAHAGVSWSHPGHCRTDTSFAALGASQPAACQQWPRSSAIAKIGTMARLPVPAILNCTKAIFGTRNVRVEVGDHH